MQIGDHKFRVIPTLDWPLENQVAEGVAELHSSLSQKKTQRSTSNFGSKKPTQVANKLESLRSLF